MAAPSSAYRSYKAHDGTTVANSVKADVAIPNVSEATLKARFYLDHFLSDEKDGQGGFIGGCVIGGDNHAMHNSARHWTARSRNAAGHLVQWFNDAGLNTLGMAVRTGLPIATYANYFIVPSVFTSAWYVGTSRIGYQIRLQGATSWITATTIGPVTLPQQQVLTKNLNFFLIGNLYNQGDRVDIRPFIENAEGTYYGAIYNFEVGKNLENWPAEYRGTSLICEDSGDQRTLLMMDDVLPWLQTFKTLSDVPTGRYLYGSINESTGALVPAQAGWYQGLVLAEQHRLVRVAANGEVRETYLCSETVTEPLIASVVPNFGMDETFKVLVSVNKDPLFTSAITVSGQVQELNAANGLVRGIPYTLTIPANATGGESPTFSLLDPSNKFRLDTATASPANVNGVNTNPVKINNPPL